MLTAGAGRLVSPFANDPFALVALAFKNLYPEREYAAYFVPEVEDGSGGAACGVTTFPEDGSPPVVECIRRSPPLRRALRYLRTNWRMSPRRKIGSMAKRGRPPLTVFFEEYNRIAQDIFGGKWRRTMLNEREQGRPRSHDCRTGAGALPFAILKN